MKKVFMFITSVTFTTFAYSQTIPQQAEKQIADPQRKANAGKADVIIANKKNIFDSTTFINNTKEATTAKTVKKSVNKKYCGNKTKQRGKASGLKNKR